jgi:hypothetical protein
MNCQLLLATDGSEGGSCGALSVRRSGCFLASQVAKLGRFLSAGLLDAGGAELAGGALATSIPNDFAHLLSGPNHDDGSFSQAAGTFSPTFLQISPHSFYWCLDAAHGNRPA